MAAFTHKGQALVAELMAAGKRLVIDQVVFANIPDLEVEGDIDRETEKPSSDLIVHEAPIYRASFVNESAVVYSAFLNSTVGPFTFNWFGLYCSEHKTLVALEYTAPQKKVKTENGVFGNNLVKNLVIQFNSAQAVTGIEIPVESWQLNFADQVNELYARTEQATEETKGIVSIASLEEIKKGDSAIKVVTPSALKPVLDEMRNNLEGFKNRKDNPHQVSKHQVGLGQVNNFPATSQLTESSNEKIPTCAVTYKLDEQKAQRYHTHTLDEVGLPNVQNLPIVHQPEDGRKDQYASGHAAKLAHAVGQGAAGQVKYALDLIGNLQQNQMKMKTLHEGIIEGEGWGWQSPDPHLYYNNSFMFLVTVGDSGGLPPNHYGGIQTFSLSTRMMRKYSLQRVLTWMNLQGGLCTVYYGFSYNRGLELYGKRGNRTTLLSVEVLYR